MNLKIKSALAVAALALGASAAQAAIPSGDLVFNIWNANTTTQGFTLDTGLNLSTWNPATSFTTTITNAGILSSFNADMTGTYWEVVGGNSSSFATSVTQDVVLSGMGSNFGLTAAGALGIRSAMGTFYNVMANNKVSQSADGTWAATMSQGGGALNETTDYLVDGSSTKLNFEVQNSSGNPSLYSGFWTLSFLNAAGGAATQGTATQAVLSWTATAVPVPAAIWLLGSGLAGLAGVGRRRQMMAA